MLMRQTNKPKGINHFNTNENFRNIMKEIIDESQSFYTGSKMDYQEMNSLLYQNDFGMDFQNFIDDWTENKIKRGDE